MERPPAWSSTSSPHVLSVHARNVYTVMGTRRQHQWGSWQRRVNDKRREENAGGRGRSEQMQRKGTYLFILTCSLIASMDKVKQTQAKTENTVIRLKDPTDVHLFSSWIQISNFADKVEVQIFTFKPHNQFSIVGFEYDNQHGQTSKLIFM